MSELAFGEVDLGDGRRLVVTREPGLWEPTVTIALQRLHGRLWDTEDSMVMGLSAAKSMAGLLMAFSHSVAPKGG